MHKQLPITTNWLAYAQRLDQRTLDEISTVVIHCTETPNLNCAREFGEQIHYPQSATGNSGHYYIDLDGSIEQWVPLDRIAHHVANLNHHSIGIELVNQGRWPDWFDSRQQDCTTPYTNKQIERLITLLSILETELPSIQCITGHEQLDTRMTAASDNPELLVRRKIDPGPLFPWATIKANTKSSILTPNQP